MKNKNASFQFDVAVIHFNNVDRLWETLQALKIRLPQARRFVVIDNSNIPSIAEEARLQCSQIGVFYWQTGGNLGWGRAINEYMRSNLCDSDFVFFAAHDAHISEICLERISYCFSDPLVWCVGPKNLEKTICSFSPSRFFYFRLMTPVEQKSEIIEVPVCNFTGAFFNSELIKAMSFDEEFFIYGCESEIFLRAKRLGLRSIQANSFEVINPETDAHSDFVRRAFTINSFYCAWKYGGAVGWFLRLARVSISAVRNFDSIKIHALIWSLGNRGKGFRSYLYGRRI